MRNAVFTYADLPEDSVDVVLIGTSGIHCTYIPGQAYNEYGLATYGLTVDGMQPWHVLQVLKYALKYQTPELIVFDMRMFLVELNDSYETNAEVRSRYFNEIFPMLSYNRIVGVDRTLKYLSKTTDRSRFDFSFYLNVIRYHDMWENELDFSVLKNSYAYPFGFRLTKSEFNTVSIPQSVFSDRTLELEWFCEECLNELIDFCKKHALNIMFVNTPHYVGKNTAQRMNS